MTLSGHIALIAGARAEPLAFDLGSADTRADANGRAYLALNLHAPADASRNGEMDLTRPTGHFTASEMLREDGSDLCGGLKNEGAVRQAAHPKLESEMSEVNVEDRRLLNLEVYRRKLAAQNGKDKDAFLDCLADDIVFEAPAYSNDGKPIAAGKAEMARMFDSLTSIFETMEYSLKRVIPAVDPDLVIAEVTGNNLVASNGTRYCNSYLFLATCRAGKIAHIFEYSNPKVYAETAGAS
jgi:ketosteroid isomerase-like protein